MILIHGNIGAGKTENGAMLGQSDSFIFIREPVDRLRKLKMEIAENLLQEYYDDPEKHAFNYQLAMATARTKRWDWALIRFGFGSHKRMVSDSSLYHDRKVFAEYRRGLGQITPEHWKKYDMAWNLLESYPESYTDLIDLILYLRTPHETCIKREDIRGRPEEMELVKKLFEDLGGRNDEWMLGERNPGRVEYGKDGVYKAEIVSGTGKVREVPVIAFDGMEWLSLEKTYALSERYMQ
jgi:deoxyadenosine/deoxycytidine kinase